MEGIRKETIHMEKKPPDNRQYWLLLASAKVNLVLAGTRAVI